MVVISDLENYTVECVVHPSVLDTYIPQDDNIVYHLAKKLV